MTRKLLFIGVIAAALVLAGCAQTSQQLRLGPQAEVPESSIGDGHQVAVRVEDQRDDRVLGYLENRDREPGELTSAVELRHVVMDALEKALERNGFTVVDWSDEAPRRLKVQIIDVEHNVSAAVPRDVETRVELRSEAHRDGSRVTGRTTARGSDQVTHRPDADDNARYLDGVIARALERLVTVDLLDFLTDEE
ncbi:YajG family lipoprotein [Aquisalimonas sp.]|uniref:YajG family lipoprotein n=1 Tax=unclassified Aquisalimonas TaxID=2644645 RepID=UPI0025C08BDD|nr:YajG family lipoprotein [Aquisalimonas sp.]